MASMKIKKGDSWHTVKQPWVKIGGQWKAAKAAWVKVGGQWKPCYTSFDPKITAYVGHTSGTRTQLYGYSFIPPEMMGSCNPSDYTPDGLGGKFLSIVFKEGYYTTDPKYSYVEFAGTSGMPAAIHVDWRSSDGKFRGLGTSESKQTVGRNTRYNFGGGRFSALGAVYRFHVHGGAPNDIAIDIRPA